MSKAPVIDIAQEVVNVEEGTILLRLPYRDLLVKAAALEGFREDQLNEFIAWALLNHTFWYAHHTAGEEKLAMELCGVMNERWPIGKAS